MVEGDSTHIAQLVRLLIGNALENAQDSVAIEVTTYPLGREAVIEVSDNGPGIAPDNRDHIFDRYIKGTGSGKNGTHTGLGLAIAKSITQAHGGTIIANDSPRGGACFIVRLSQASARA